MNPLFLILAALACVGGGYWWGANATTNAYEADKTSQVVQANADLVAAAAAANIDAAAATTAAVKARADFRALQRSFRELDKTTPILAAAPACEPVAKSNDLAPAQPQPPRPDPTVLSLAAVWVWDSALAGADLPAGACGAADTSFAACAPAAGLTLADAWANHAANSETCAEDRARHQRLIDHLNRRGQPAAPGTPGAQP